MAVPTALRAERADMVNLELGRQFDVVLCLFSSIGYVRTRALLKKTLFSFARHLKAGGARSPSRSGARAAISPGPSP
jgi:hypothetical protein